MKYIPFVAEIAKGILHGVMDCAEAAGRGDHSGLKQLLDCIALETQLLNQVGHARPEEGSEHYFAYAVENIVGAGKPHAELVCPGILLMASLQGQDIAPLKQAIKACKISLNAIPIEAIEGTLRELPQYVRRHQLPYGVAHEINESLIAKMDIETILS
jgi:glycerol-1-phosphate dehydrogenase [NAD(P)+]